VVFVTVCTARRREILASPVAHEAIVEAWRAASTWLVRALCPDAGPCSFLLLANAGNAPSLERWMRFWKSMVTRELNWQSGQLWQRHHWDRQLRSEERYGDKWEYVRSNPMRHGLVSRGTNGCIREN
jgi:REP element-mobilizing transposase RayT